MFLVLSGEGASDMGGAPAQGGRPGPMAHIVDRFILEKFEFSPLNSGLVHWVSRSELSEICKSQRLTRHMLLPGVRRAAGFAGFTKHAAALAWKATELEREENDKSVAVMFRDSDGTQSSVHDNWERVTEAVELGFDTVGFKAGVPMIPKPKQEAWMLCAKKGDPYMHCHLLEEESGNDHCPNPLKAQLSAVCGGEPLTDEMCDWIASGEVDVHRIDMPSFNRFRCSMNKALDALAGA